MKALSEIYINFVLSSFEKIEMTKLSKILGKGNGHDIFIKIAKSKIIIIIKNIIK